MVANHGAGQDESMQIQGFWENTQLLRVIPQKQERGWFSLRAREPRELAVLLAVTALSDLALFRLLLPVPI